MGDMMTNHSMIKHCDVLIIGGGMVGTALACVLAKQGFEVRLVEAIAPQAFALEQPLDLRVSAVSLASQNVLEVVGAWAHVLALRATPFRRMRVWDGAGLGDTRFDSRDIGEPVLGHIVENRILQLALWQAAKGLEAVDWHCPARLDGLQINAQSCESGVVAQLSDGHSIHAKLIVGADGAHSRLRELAHIGVTSWDYDVEALVATIKTHAPQQDMTWQRFMPSGPQAMLPLPGSYASLVWYHAPDEVARLLALDEADFLAELLRTFPRELGGVEAVLGRGSFRLTRRHAQVYAKPRLVLVGDAAHTINPLAGQGVNLGFMDVAALAETLVKARVANQDIGALHVLQSYERQRRGENLLMQSTMDMFHHLFKPAHGVVPLLRGVVLRLANDLPPLKRLLTRRATGRGGELAKMARTGRLD
jgi:2-octaprenyl-3-methyl-6-methoxy-1,4-benzoquinol hydroxylase